MFLSKAQYDAVMVAMEQAEQPCEFPLNPKDSSVEFARLSNTLWVADRLVTAAGEEKWWFKIDAATLPATHPTHGDALGATGTPRAQALPPAFTPVAPPRPYTPPNLWPGHDVALHVRPRNVSRVGNEVPEAANTLRWRRLVDSMTGADPTPETKEAVTYNAYLKRRWINLQTGAFVPPHTIGSVPRAEYYALTHVDQKSGVRVAADAPATVPIEAAEIKLSWQSKRQKEVCRIQTATMAPRVVPTRVLRSATAKQRAAPGGTTLQPASTSPRAASDGATLRPAPASPRAAFRQGSESAPKAGSKAAFSTERFSPTPQALF